MVNHGAVLTTIPAASRLKWDVFLSFRGEDTRGGITESLYNTLTEKGIRVFRDDDGLRRGDRIAPSLLEAIEDSAASIVILSRRYADSHWCLEELARICELKRLILPVFYAVDPSDVRKQRGPFEEDFGRHEKRFGIHMVRNWREAMKTVGGIAGLVFKDNSDDEKQLIQVLLREVLKEVNNTPLEVASYAVGLDTRVADLIDLLDVKSNGIKILGLHGIGGIGKTTLAKAVYNKILPHFQSRSFISYVRELSRHEDGLVSLQNKLIYDLSNASSNSTNIDANASKIRNIYQENNVLVVLDDVDQETQLHALGVRICEWQSGGRSRIIVTTRNKGMLSASGNYVNQLYEVKELYFEQALELFSYYALRRPKPTDEFLQLSKQIVLLTGNLPLAVEVFGSFLLDKRKVSEWEDALKKLRETRPHELQDVLKISFDALDVENQCIFLDIACLFVTMRMNREDVVDVLRGCDFKAEIAIRVLEEKSLIKFTEDDTLVMHDQLRDMGRQIVRKENFGDPGMRSRLWDRNEIITVLENHKGTRIIEGIVMDIEKEPERNKEVVVCTKPFESMVSLRLLEINYVKLDGKFKFLPRELKWLQWRGCNLKTLPSDFCPQKLAVLDLSGSKSIEQVWSSYTNKVAEKLMVMNLSGCSNLAALPDLSGQEKLQKIVLKNCVKLTGIHESVGNLKSLQILNLTGCNNLVEFPSDVQGMKNLQTLILVDCSKLKKLPESIGCLKSLQELYVDSSGIEKLPESIYRLEKLEKLSLNRCMCIKQLPRSVGKLVSLKELHLDHSALEQLPDSVGDLENLEKLSLISCKSLTRIPDTVGNLKLLKELLIKGRATTQLPNSVGSLSYLKCLYVGGNQLRKLPDTIQGLGSLVELEINDASITDLPCEIGSLRLLNKFQIINCRSLNSLPESIGSLLALTYLNIFNANITELPESFGMLENLIMLRLNGCKRLSKLPSSIGGLKSLHHLYMEKTAVIELPESFGMLSSLMVLKVRKEEKSKSCVLLPPSFSNLSSLKEFDAHAWRISGEISNDFEKLSSLEILKLGKNDFSKLPSSLKGLSLLRKLLLPDCGELSSLPPLPSSLVELNLANCISLESMCDLSNLRSLEDLNLTNCEKLVDIPGLESLKSLRTLYMSNCHRCSSATKKRLSKVYLKNLRNLSMPGSKIPDWFSPDTVTFSSHKNLDFKGVIIAVVVWLNHQIPDELRYQIPDVVDIQAKIFDGDKEIFTTVLHLKGIPKTNEDHVHLCRYSALHQLVFFLKDGFQIQVKMRNPPFVKGVELKKAGIYLVFENDDDYEGDEESLDDSQQTVSQRLAKFFYSLEEEKDNRTCESSYTKQGTQHLQIEEEKKQGTQHLQIEEKKLQPSNRSRTCFCL